MAQLIDASKAVWSTEKDFEPFIFKLSFIVPSKDQLCKTLTLWRGTAIMLNIVLGAGLLVLPGLTFKQVGNSAFFTWIICCVAVIPLLTVFTILGRLYPDAGGIPHFAGRAFGRFIYIASSFLLIGAVVFGLPSIALTGGHYASAAFGGNPHVHAVALVIFASILNLLSIKISGLINQVLSFVLLGFMVIIIVVSFIYIPQSTALPIYAETDISLFYKALLPLHMVIFAFTGWEIAAGLSEEFMNPRRDFPRAMFLSFVIASTLYLFMAYIAQTRDLSAGFESPFAMMFGIRFGASGRVAIAVVAVTIIGINLAAAIWGVSRLIFSLGREGRTPKASRALDQRTTHSFGLLALPMSCMCCIGAGCWFDLIGKPVVIRRSKLLYSLRSGSGSVVALDPPMVTPGLRSISADRCVRGINRTGNITCLSVGARCISVCGAQDNAAHATGRLRDRGRIMERSPHCLTVND